MKIMDVGSSLVTLTAGVNEGFTWFWLVNPRSSQLRNLEDGFILFFAKPSTNADVCHDCASIDDHVLVSPYMWPTTAVIITGKSIVLCIDVYYMYCTWGTLHICEYGV